MTRRRIPQAVVLRGTGQYTDAQNGRSRAQEGRLSRKMALSTTPADSRAV